ncbi:MAG: alpha/beta hydrolase [Bdellovibrionaceae bacterium]|jgi:pimeloyl-ACP methyl ester carboxylesterase|nr:alpha/beta hydrolase [Pseudobdellovibrionaceae bacterium]
MTTGPRVTKQSFFIPLRDGSIHYAEVRGSGTPPLVLVYGIACQMNHWNYQMAELAQERQVVSYDLRGHVRSEKGHESELTVSGLVEDLHEILGALSIHSAHLAGHSFGVPIAVEFASRYPDLTHSLTLINGFVTNPMQNFMGMNVPQVLFPFLLELQQTDPEAFKKIWQLSVENPLATLIAGLTGGFNLKATELKDIEIYTHGVATMDTHTFFTLFRALLDYDGRESVKTIRAPTLVIGGEKDQITPLRYQKEIFDLLPETTPKRLVTVDYGSHCCQLDFPDYVNLLMREHFQWSSQAQARVLRPWHHE